MKHPKHQCDSAEWVISEHVVSSTALSTHFHHLPANRVQGLRPQENPGRPVPWHRTAMFLCLLRQTKKQNGGTNRKTKNISRGYKLVKLSSCERCSGRASGVWGDP